MRKTVIDIRPDGSHILTDPNATAIFHYPPELLQAAGALPKEELAGDTEKNPTLPNLDRLGGIAKGVGAFYDALIAKGVAPEVAHELMWAAHGKAA